jgi:hypothetical protein
MAVAKQQLSYQCDLCGSPNIVALPVLHEQGTRTYSSPTNWGSSQSSFSSSSAPPRRKGYGGPFLLWGFLLSFFLFWSWACYSAMLKYPKTASSMEYPLGRPDTIKRSSPCSTRRGRAHTCAAAAESCFIFLHNSGGSSQGAISRRPAKGDKPRNFLKSFPRD